MAQHPPEKPKPAPAKPAQKTARAAEKPQEKAEAARELEPTEVAAYLRRHPDFLASRPDLVTVLAPPERDLGDGVVDMQRFMVERLRADVARLKLVQRKLISTSRNNLTSQGRVHAAVLALLGATSFEHLITVITDELTMLLDIDAVGLCVESSQHGAGQLPSNTAGVQMLEPGSADELLGNTHVLLRSDVIGDPALFGPQASSLLRSDALVRLKVSRHAPAGLLALGARRPGVFHPGQGTELLVFLGQVIEHLIRAWLDLEE
jgi:uncharacterized protein